MDDFKIDEIALRIFFELYNEHDGFHEIESKVDKSYNIAQAFINKKLENR